MVDITDRIVELLGFETLKEKQDYCIFRFYTL
jgi:hypothetical protein